MKNVVCIAAQKPWCPGCLHYGVHGRYSYSGGYCTAWFECQGTDGKPHKVRCTRVREVK